MRQGLAALAVSIFSCKGGGSCAVLSTGFCIFLCNRSRELVCCGMGIVSIILIVCVCLFGWVVSFYEVKESEEEKKEKGKNSLAKKMTCE